jgi:hypothetical protein
MSKRISVTFFLVFDVFLAPIHSTEASLSDSFKVLEAVFDTGLLREAVFFFGNGFSFFFLASNDSNSSSLSDELFEELLLVSEVGLVCLKKRILKLMLFYFYNSPFHCRGGHLEK